MRATTTEPRDAGPSQPLRFRFAAGDGELVSEPQVVVVAGYTGRDRAAVLRHVRELEEQGVPPPPAVPAFYAVSPQLVTQGRKLITAETATSGEAEVALVVHQGDVFVTVASDHTDREAERVDVCLSKRACHKVVASCIWRLSEVAGHWDSLRLRSWLGEGTLYQDGVLGSLLSPTQLLDAIPWKKVATDFVVLCGTLPAIGGIRPSPLFRAELSDAVAGRRIELEYEVLASDFLLPPPHMPDALDGAPPGLGRVRQVSAELGVNLASGSIATVAERLAGIEHQLLP